MNPALPVVYVVRHADTAWTLTGQHTGRTDLPLTEQGERQARALGPSLTALHVDRIVSSPSSMPRMAASRPAASAQ
ncbi:MAG: histidine phosphatase family protein [Deltaproteobacteria bacterium]|nr:histidine phosphatase family protein [Kofleriaceae bacterium]